MSIADKLTQIAENEQRVYDAGKKAQYDEFWDTYQDYGNRKTYDFAFAESASGQRWINGITYKPKYPLKPTSAMNMFYATRLPYEVLKEVDFSDCKEFYNVFGYARMERLGVIDMRKATRTAIAFDQCTLLHTIDEIISSETTSFTSTTFRDASSLENLTVSGTIGNSVDFQWSTKLSKASIISVIKALWDSASGKTLTLSSAAVNAIEWAGTVIDGVTYNTFDDVANIKPNWNISLI